MSGPLRLLQVYGCMARSNQRLAPPTYPSHYGSALAPYPHPPSSPPPRPTAAYPGPSVAHAPGRAVPGTPFDSLPLDHQNFILKTATHCWRDQYAALQQDNASLRASLASDRQQHKILKDRVQLLEQQLILQRVVKLEPVV